MFIEAKDLSYSYPFCDAKSLDGVSFSLGRGEAMLVTGPSGCGKSTLLRILNGLVPNHFKGTLGGRLKVMELSFPSPLESVSSIVGTVLQNPEEQILATTVAEEVALALEWKSVPVDEIRERTSKAIASLGLERLADRSVFNLSSGERQKCVIASVMASGADVVVMDEPTANLSPEATDDLADLCRELKRRGVTIVVVDHRLYWLRGVLDALLVLSNGRAVFSGRTTEGRDVLDILAAQGGFGTWGLRSVNVERPDLPSVDALPISCACTSAIEVKNLSFRYSRKAEWIYRDFSASIPKGRVTAVTGANGAGKTTLARILCGLVKPSSGEILFAGKPLSPKARRVRTAFVMQQMDIQLYMRTVEAELLFSAPRRLSAAERRTDAARWLGVFGLAHLKDRHPHSLSGGEKQRLVVACALMKRPELLILDEPTSGLDGRNMRIIADVLRDYAAACGSVLLITHDLELLSLVADSKLEISPCPRP